MGRNCFRFTCHVYYEMETLTLKNGNGVCISLRMLTVGILLVSACNLDTNHKQAALPEEKQNSAVNISSQRVSEHGVTVRFRFTGDCESDGTFTGVHIQKKSSDEIEGIDLSVARYQHGKRHGLQKSVSPFGEKTIDHYQNGVLHGTHLKYAANGVLIQSTAYNKGVETGTSRRWRKDGKLHTHREMRNGRLEGKVARFWHSGKLDRMAYYSDDKPNGDSWSFYEDGTVKSHYIYKDGIRVGPGRHFDTQGKFIESMADHVTESADTLPGANRFDQTISGLLGAYSNDAPTLRCADIPGLKQK